MRNLPAIPLIVLLLTGCVPQDSPPPHSTNTDTASSIATATSSLAPAPQAEPPLIEITSEAKAELSKVAQAQNAKQAWWLRITIKPGGCQGMTSSLDLDLEGAGTGDAEYRCGDIRCLTAANHAFLIQGVQVGWKHNDKESGFTVTFPNKTAENQEKTQKSIEDEFKARLGKSEEQAQKDKVRSEPRTKADRPRD